MRSGPRRRPGKCRFGYYSPLGVGGDGRDVHTDPDGTVHGRADREREREREREPDRRIHRDGEFLSATNGSHLYRHGGDGDAVGRWTRPGRRLRAVARYTDAQGGGKRSLSEATAPIRLDPASRATAVEMSLASFGRTVASAARASARCPPCADGCSGTA